MQELAILKWAAGATSPLPQIGDIDEDLLLEAVRHHRLEGRLLHRLRLEAQPWAGQSLLDELETRQSAVRRRVNEQISLLKEIHRDYSACGRRVIVIKGITSHLLLGDPATIRYSGDVDILYTDADGMHDTLARLGYEWALPDHVNPHHSPRAFRGNLSVDSYDYIPVPSYSDDTAVEDLDPALHPGVWNQTARPLHNGIRFADVAENSFSNVGTEAEPLIIADPTMTILIACTHLFNDFFSRMPFRFATLPLSTFAEICELSRHPRFDQKRFARLVQRFNASDCVQFTEELLMSYMGYDPLASRLLGSGTRREWMHCFRFVFWLPTPWTHDDLLLLEEPSRPLMELHNELGANLVIASRQPNERTYQALLPGSDQPLERVITRNVGGKQLPLEVSLGWGIDTVVLTIRVVSLPDTEYDHLSVQFSGFSSYWVVSRDSLLNEIKTAGDSTRVNVAFDESGYTLTFSMPNEMWQDLLRNDRPVPLLLAAIRMSVGPTGWPTYGRTESATLLPMNVVKD